jgi:hypothetical protein
VEFLTEIVDPIDNWIKLVTSGAEKPVPLFVEREVVAFQATKKLIRLKVAHVGRDLSLHMGSQKNAGG